MHLAGPAAIGRHSCEPSGLATGDFLFTALGQGTLAIEPVASKVQ